LVGQIIRAAMLVLFALVSPVFAGTKLALVIGNGHYQNVGELRNPINDADLISATLRRVGFSVTDKRDLNSTELRATIIDFLNNADHAGPDTIVLLYYAGHGAQIGEENYLVPVDASATSSITLQAFKLSEYIDGVPSGRSDSGGRTKIVASIVILDACRDNPFATSVRGGSRGLSPITRAGSVPTYIMFAAAPGKAAQDGSGDHSPFSQALADNLGTPGIPLEVLARQVSAAVSSATNGEQQPWSNGFLTEAVYIAGGPAVVEKPQEQKTQATQPVRPPPEAADFAYFNAVRQNTFEAYEAVLREYPDHPKKQEILNAMRSIADEERWKAVSKEGTLGAYKQYLDQFPTGTYIEIARQKIAELTQGTDEVYCKSPTNLDAARVRGRDALVEFNDRCSHVVDSLALQANQAIGDLDRESKAFDSYSGVDFDGDDRGSWLYNQSLQGCTDACRADNGCRAFTFNTRKSVCILKSGYGTPKRSNEAISAVVHGLSIPPPQDQNARMQLQRGIDYPGNDIDANGYRPVTLEACASQCTNNSQCKGFAYVPASSWCWLKYQIGQGIVKSNVISGVKLFGPSGQLENDGTSVSAAATPTPSSFWSHNGSIVSLLAQGDDRSFYYEEPRAGMVNAGAHKGDLLFSGSKVGDTYVGTAYVFSSTCGKTAYRVSGPVGPESTQITMRGQAPLLDKNCEIAGHRDDELIFNYIKSAQ
jgi:hypothetical protein